MTRPGTAEVEEFLERLVRWVGPRKDVRALALVGSWAYGAPREHSDVDVVLLTETPLDYIERDDWLGELGPVELVQTAGWGAITERRLVLPSGLEIDLGIGAPTWASLDPLDDGTRRVASDGMRVLYDPDRLLVALLGACATESQPCQKK